MLFALKLLIKLTNVQLYTETYDWSLYNFAKKKYKHIILFF